MTEDLHKGYHSPVILKLFRFLGGKLGLGDFLLNLAKGLAVSFFFHGSRMNAPFLFFKRIFLISLLTFYLGTLIACGRSYSTYFVSNKNIIKPLKSVAVLPLENLTATPGAGSAMTDLLLTELHNINRYQVMGKIEMDKAFREKNIELPKIVDRSVAAEIGRQLNVDGVFFGSVTEYLYRKGQALDDEQEPAVGINLRLVSSKSGTVIWGSSFARSSYEVFTYEKDALTRVALKAIREMLDPLRRS